jgi:hypothetical protein
MISMQSVCIYHNGNSRILAHYKQKFSHLKFVGNLAESADYPAQGHMWEVCFADANRTNLFRAKKHGVYILRHVSDFQDDLQHLLPECQSFNHDTWLTHVVTNQLSFADHVVCDFVLKTQSNNSTVIVTTGRTANTYFQEILTRAGMTTFENSKFLTDDFLSSSIAVLLWRLDQWECLTSIWIAAQTDYKYSHQLAQSAPLKFDFNVDEIPVEWINTDWFNMCSVAFDHSLLYKYVLQKPIYSAVTERIVEFKTTTIQQKLNYDKSKIIPNHKQMQLAYEQSEIADILTMLYNQTQHHIKEINYEETLLHGVRAV